MGSKLKKIKLFMLFFFTVYSAAHATPENDRMYALDHLTWLKPIDNVDGIFNDFVDEIYTNYFKAQTRFQIINIGKAGLILEDSKIPYFKIAKDAEVLKKVAHQLHSESILRTQISKEGSSYRFQLEWIYAPRGDILSQFEFRYFDQGKEKGLKESDLPQAIHKALDEVITKLPYLGQVTGVEGENLTINMGRNQGVHTHEILTIYSLQALKRHPLDHTIEEWRWTPIGKAQAEQVEESLSFAKVIETEPEQKFDRYQKVREILAAPVEQDTDAEKEARASKRFREIPRIGWVAANIGAGLYNREVSQASGTTGVTGGGLMGNFELDSQFWLNSRFITQASLSTALLKYSSKQIATETENFQAPSGNATQLRIAFGYSLFEAKTIFDPSAWVHLGYKNTSYSLTTDSTVLTGSSSFGSLFLGLGGDIPLDYGFAAQMGFDIGLLRSFSQVFPAYGDATSTSDLLFSLGGTYRYTERIFFRLLLKINSQSADFLGGESISQKMFTLSPSVMYYF